MRKNKWVFIPKGNITEYLPLDGNDIKDLRSGTLLTS